MHNTFLWIVLCKNQMNHIKLRLEYLLNPGLREKSERVFHGIEEGRTKALYNWFEDNWTSIELLKGKLLSYPEYFEVNNRVKLNELLCEHKSQFIHFSEMFLCNNNYEVISSTYKDFIGRKVNKEYTKIFDQKMKYMYGPFEDKDTVVIGECISDFFDEVTLMFIEPLVLQDKDYFICGRIPNDVMSDILQHEDSHIYKESGDNYLFMVDTNRDIPVGSAISRSRFEDNTFTLGDNLKDGIKTNGYGVVRVEKYTEFEIIFNNPKTQRLHEGIKKTIENGSNINAWPGYPEYRHILVGGKGVIIKPPHTREKWGLLCEGDIDEIYKYRSINLKYFSYLGIMNALFIVLAAFVKNRFPKLAIVTDISLWVIMMSLFLIISTYITLKPMKKTIKFLKDIAEGEGDLTKRIDISTNDETGELAKWFNKFVNSQMHIVKRIINATNITNKSVKDLNILTQDISISKNNMENSVTYLLDIMMESVEHLSTVQNKFGEIATSIGDIYHTVSNTKKQMIETNDSAISSQLESEKVSQMMSEIVLDISNTRDGILELEKCSLDVSKVVSVIDTISKQTKLLALNASIEAARAGEHGLGFRVVAEEISKLADMTTKSTAEISSIIQIMEDEVSNSKGHVEYIDRKIKNGNVMVNHSAQSFMSIQQDISSMTTEFENTSQRMDQSSKSVHSIKEFLQNVMENVEQSSKVSESKSNEIIKTLSAQVKSMEEVKDSLGYTSSNLAKMVNEFKI